MSVDEIVELGGKKYRRRLSHGYYCLRPIDGDGDKSTIMEHRLVYELAHGVTLDRRTHIHHLNRDRTDNRISNLIAVSVNDHRKLHNFEDQYFDMQVVMEHEEKARQYRSLAREGLIKATEEKVLKSIVVYDGVIYRRFLRDGYAKLSPIVDGKVDYSVVIPEHRLVYELANNVKLPPNKQVHHINGVIDDNRPENLTTITKRTRRIKDVTYEELSKLIETKSNTDIANMYGVRLSTVGNWRKKFGLPSASEMRRQKREHGHK